MRSLSFCLATLAFVAGAASADPSKLTVTDAWMRALPSGLPAGGYFKLRNDGDAAMTLTGAMSPACGMLMLHKSDTGSGMATMDDVPSVEVPPHGSLAFAPGGYHLMCMQPSASLKPGATVPVTLEFADRSRVTADFAVRNAAGK